ncbi:MAG: hemerythrin domain-containing protein [Syntrophomonas sp.]
MKATGQLIQEHQAVLLMLQIMEAICSDLDQGVQPNTDELDSVIDFLKGFVDKCHHGKEEDILFPELEARRVPNVGGPIDVMLSEHQRGRILIKEMAEGVRLFKAGLSESISKQLVPNAREYTKLLREHIAKENQVLFKMADSLIDETSQNELYEKFEELEFERMGSGQHEAYHHLLHELAKQHLGDH